jgi:Sulfotransferase domain
MTEYTNQTLDEISSTFCTKLGDTLRRPTFLYIGAPKSGSTWIYHALREHPDVFIPPAKDLQFFDYHYDQGENWYLQHFKSAGSATALGELSHDYFLSEKAARRIQATLPGIRLIVCLREPGDFAVSALRWWKTHTRHSGATYCEMAQSPEFRRRLAYRKNLEAYYSLFPRNRILVVFYEQLKSDPSNFIRRLYQFIGVNPNYLPMVLEQKLNGTRMPRNRLALSYATETAQFLRRLGGANLVGMIRSNPIFDMLMYRSSVRDEDPYEKLKLECIAKSVRRRAVRDHVALAQLIGKPLPKEWLIAGIGRE